MASFLNTLVARLADYIEFDAALWSNKSIARLDHKQIDMGEQIADAMWERVKKAAGFAANEHMPAEFNLPYNDAHRVVADRQRAAKRLSDHRRAQQEELRKIQGILAQG